ncbi:MAG: endonuclease/exonuclease/phosphatase family protein [Pedobacter sp.]|nr:endonuclease/exonuclease/phosphatase family protein [Pedobacter sp.]MDQ8052645.1 endonuclease/exonuclease/phosphatase family protein [Pedobacter sp.]
MPKLNRRNFLKGSGVVAAASCLPLKGMANGLLPESASFSETHTVMGCNIRVALPEDDALGRGWRDRKKSCLTIIKGQKADLIGFQEVLKVQADDLKKAMPDYGCFGFEGPEMDVSPETYNGIAKNLVMYAKKRYEMVSAGCYWLSETPEIAGSKSWNTARARHVNWLRLKDRQSGREFRLMAVHLDHKDQEARNKQGQLIVRESAQYLPDFPQILVGDFNVTAQNPVYSIITAGGWKDTYPAIHGDKDPGATFHNFEGTNYAKAKTNGKIDFIFTRGKVAATAASIVYDQLDGVYPSDHFFIKAKIVFR